MSKELIPTNRGLEPELENFVYSKPIPVVKEDKEDDELVYKKVIESGKGYLIVDTNKGKLKFSNGTIAWRNNNPGNLKYGNFSKANGAIGTGVADLAVFPTLEIGEKAQIELLFGENSIYKNLTLQETINKYAPKYDGNDPKEYANYVSRKAGIAKTMNISKLNSSQRKAMVQAMRTIEGFEVGKVSKV